MSIRVSRAIIEVTVVTIGWLLGGPAGIGTVVFALLIGPSVQWGFKDVQRAAAQREGSAGGH